MYTLKTTQMCDLIRKFMQDTENSNKPLILCFTANWCGPCKKHKPVLYGLRDEGLIDLIIYDVEEYEDLVSDHNVMSVPTTICFSSGSEVFREVGYLSEATIKELLNGSI